MNWTVSCNHTEYCEGIFDTEEEAEQHAIKLVRGDCPEAEGMSDEDTLEYVDGYYRVMWISPAS